MMMFSFHTLGSATELLMPMSESSGVGIFMFFIKSPNNVITIGVK